MWSNILSYMFQIADEVNGNASIGCYIGAGIAILSAGATGLGEAIACAKACEAVARNPEAESKIRNMMIVGCAIAETSCIYGLIIAILLIFVAAPK